MIAAKFKVKKMYKKTILKNGLRIITMPMKNTEAITVLVLVGAGSKYETKEINGISHFLEHMLFKGTKKYPNTQKLIEPLDRIGGIYNAFTSKECTGYWTKVDHSHLDIALDWISDIYLNSRLNEKEIEKEKGVIIEEINMYLDMPEKYVFELWEKLLYGDQPAGWLISGEKEIINKFKKQDFLDYRKNYYSAKNTIICVAGNIDSDSCIKKIEKCFKRIEARPVKSKPKVIERQKKPNCLLYSKKTDQTHLYLGVRGYNFFHPRRYAQELLAIILGGMMSSRLWIEIREKLGLAYYINTSDSTDSDTGFLATQAGVDNRRVEIAIKAILKEYQNISQKGVSKEELQRAKDNIKGHLTLSLESSEAQASFYGMQELLEKKILSPKEIYAKIDRVTNKDILITAKDIFQPKNLNLALIGPYKDDKLFKKLLSFYCIGN